MLFDDKILLLFERVFFVPVALIPDPNLNLDAAFRLLIHLFCVHCLPHNFERVRMSKRLNKMAIRNVSMTEITIPMIDITLPYAQAQTNIEIDFGNAFHMMTSNQPSYEQVI